MKLWWKFLRFMTAIELDGAIKSENWNYILYCRNRIAEIDGELDRLEIQA